ncbi:MAG: hypothetical protein ACLRO4_03145 [Lachnospiraceae bacterium]
MGKKDAVSKHYMSKNEIFADAVNFYFFDGRQEVKPGDLEELDSSELVLPFGKSTGRKNTKEDNMQEKAALPVPVQKYRDILKRCVIRRCQETVYMIYGIEAQSDIHYAMPVRSMLYDALNYASQVSEIAWEHREKGTYGSSGEFLSGFHKADRLWPVQTLVVYFGSMRWDGPRSLREMLVLPEGIKKSFLNDYRLNLLVPGEIEDFSKFHSQLGAVLEVLKVMEDREAMADLMRVKSDVYEHLPRDAAELLRMFAKIDMEIEEDEEEIDMCRAIDEMMAEAREEGRAAGMRLGEELGRESLMTNMMRNFSRSGASFEEVSSFISEEDFSRNQLRGLWEKACGDKTGIM